MNLESRPFSGAPEGQSRRKGVMEIHKDSTYEKVLGAQFKEVGSPRGI